LSYYNVDLSSNFCTTDPSANALCAYCAVVKVQTNLCNSFPAFKNAGYMTAIGQSKVKGSQYNFSGANKGTFGQHPVGNNPGQAKTYTVRGPLGPLSFNSFSF